MISFLTNTQTSMVIVIPIRLGSFLNAPLVWSKHPEDPADHRLKPTSFQRAEGGLVFLFDVFASFGAWRTGANHKSVAFGGSLDTFWTGPKRACLPLYYSWSITILTHSFWNNFHININAGNISSPIDWCVFLHQQKIASLRNPSVGGLVDF